MGIEHVFIVNSAGGLIYYLSWGEGVALLGNESLRLASTFHSLHAISSQLGPLKGGGGGIKEVECDAFSLRCKKTETGLKFFVVASPQAKDVQVCTLLFLFVRWWLCMQLFIEGRLLSCWCFAKSLALKKHSFASPNSKKNMLQGFLQSLHELYADWVLKDPFYELDMPIRVEKFEQKLMALLTEKYGPRVARNTAITTQQ